MARHTPYPAAHVNEKQTYFKLHFQYVNLDMARSALQIGCLPLSVPHSPAIQRSTLSESLRQVFEHVKGYKHQ